MASAPELLGRLTRVLAVESGADLPLRMCAAFGRILEVDGVALTMGGNGDRSLLCATSPDAESLQDLQDVLREGPSLDAHRTARPAALTERRAQPTPWPMLEEALAARASVPSLHAFPMRPDRVVLGVLTAHRVRGPELAVTTEEAQFLASAIGVAVLGDIAHDDVSAHRWSTRDRIAQATGMVVAQLRLDPADALAVLRAHAYAEGVTLSDVSGRVVERTLRFGPEGDPT